MHCVTGLAGGSYQILMDEGVAAEVAAGQLSAGVNLGTAPAGAFAMRSTDLYARGMDRCRRGSNASACSTPTAASTFRCGSTTPVRKTVGMDGATAGSA
jgi:hypothetical protein